MPDEKNFVTAEQARGMVEDIIGATIKDVREKMADEQASFAKELVYAMGHTPPKPQPVSRGESLRDFSVMLGCLAQEKMHLESASKVAKASGYDRVAKALGTSTVAGGSVLITPEFAAELIPYLYAQTVIMELGAREVLMPSGILNFGRAATGVTAAYRGESTNGAVSEPSTGELSLKARILDVMTPISNQLLSRSDGRALNFVQEDLAAGVRDKADATFIRSDGTSDTPKGLRFWADTGNVFAETNAAATSGGSTVAEITADLGKALYLLMNNNIPSGGRLGWAFPPRVWHRLFTAVDANSNPVWKEEVMQGRLYGVPFRTTTNIPDNLTADAGSGGGSDATEVYLADFFQIMIGQTEALRLSSSTDASYTVGPDTFSCFQRGETLFKAEMEHDLAPRHLGKEIVVIRSCTWGTV
jgi:HK97 family phage major capsid protein